MTGRPFEVLCGDQRVTGLEWPGPGPALVLTHGAGLCAGIFEPAGAALASRCRVIAVDGRGHGRASCPTGDEAYGLAAQAEDLLAVLDALGVERAVGFGHSFGGAVLLHTVLFHPGRITALAVHEPALGNPTDPPDLNAKRAGQFARLIGERRSVWPTPDALRAEVSEWTSLREVAPVFFDALLEWGTEADPQGGVRMRCTPDVEATLFRISLSALGGNGLHEVLPKLATDDVPLTVLYGRDGQRRRPIFEAVAHAVARPLVEIPGYHMAPFGSVDTLLSLIDEHVLAHASEVAS